MSSRRGRVASGAFGIALAAAGVAHLHSRIVAARYSAVAQAAVLDMNRADAAALERLPGIGPVLAQRVVAERSAGGAFAGFADLRARVAGIGPRMEQALDGIVAFGR